MKIAISLDRKYENTKHQKLFQEVFKRGLSAKLALYDSLKPGSIQKAVNEIDELLVLLKKQSPLSSLSDHVRGPSSHSYREAIETARVDPHQEYQIMEQHGNLANRFMPLTNVFPSFES